jgi:D-aminopeptidase
LTVELYGVEEADQAQLLPGVRRLESQRLEYVADDILLAYRAFQTIATLARV